MIRRLPDEIRHTLGDAEGLPGVVALLRPLDVDALARFHDDQSAGMGILEAFARVVRRSLITLEGLQVQGAGDDAPTRFDPTNERHWAGGIITIGAISTLAALLLNRTRLTEGQEKNSDSPSASDGTSATAR